MPCIRWTESKWVNLSEKKAIQRIIWKIPWIYYRGSKKGRKEKSTNVLMFKKAKDSNQYNFFLYLELKKGIYVIYQIRETVFHRDFQTPRREKIRRAAEYFWRTSRCLDISWNTVSSVWFIFSIETKTTE